MKLSKSFGQVFLKDNNYIDKIINSLDITGKPVLEIGAGDGRISRFLVKKAKFLYCVEVDARFYNLLKKQFKDVSNIEIIHKDILKFALNSLETKVVIFGNAPYQISNYLIKYLVENRRYIEKAYLTLQKEFVEKLAAKVSTKAYGYLSCYIQFYAKVNKLFDIPSKSFTPAPKVDSSLIQIDFYDRADFKAENEEYLFKIIRAAFSGRRKKIINSLPFPKDKLNDILKYLKIPESARAENVSLEEYVKLSERGE